MIGPQPLTAIQEMTVEELMTELVMRFDVCYLVGAINRNDTIAQIHGAGSGSCSQVAALMLQANQRLDDEEDCD